ncbi:MAG: LemA family protein, partial [Candidatus Izimaplasma sp.]|nr:LemA family protein [Candidatus Izimaplasma bacterium]
ELQKARRLYNTKVLVYNQTISVFPTRFLAIKMGLQIKEYFG